MAAKKQISTPPASSQSQSSDDDSSSDEEQIVAQRAPSAVQTGLKRKQRHGDESDSSSDSGSGSESESESESDTDQLTNTIDAPKKTSEQSEEEEEEDEEEEKEEEKEVAKSSGKKSVSQSFQQSSEEEEEEEEEEGEKEEEEEEAKSKRAKKSQSQPKKKKLKTSIQSSSAKLSQRIWSSEDEVTLLEALSEYHARHGKVPTKKDYDSIHSQISKSISFLVTKEQIDNKVRHMRHVYGQRKKRGFDVNRSKSHDKKVFKICAKLFEDDKKKLSAAQGANGTGGGARSWFYLEGLIKNMISKQQWPVWLSTVEDVIEQIGESKARVLEAKAKELRIDEIKLCATEEKLIAELFQVVADEM